MVLIAIRFLQTHRYVDFDQRPLMQGNVAHLVDAQGNIFPAPYATLPMREAFPGQMSEEMKSFGVGPNTPVSFVRSNAIANQLANLSSMPLFHFRNLGSGRFPIPVKVSRTKSGTIRRTSTTSRSSVSLVVLLCLAFSSGLRKF